jgi:hypothetical protein
MTSWRSACPSHLHFHVSFHSHCACVGTSVVCNDLEDLDHNETDIDVAEARAADVDPSELCSCDVNGTLVCEEDDHAHDDEEGQCHCDGDAIHCETEELEAECHCENAEVHCEAHEGEEQHDESEDCHCDGDAVHCLTEELEAECHCDDGELHCEAHEGEECVNIGCVEIFIDIQCHDLLTFPKSSCLFSHFRKDGAFIVSASIAAMGSILAATLL